MYVCMCVCMYAGDQHQHRGSEHPRRVARTQFIRLQQSAHFLNFVCLSVFVCVCVCVYVCACLCVCVCVSIALLETGLCEVESSNTESCVDQEERGQVPRPSDSKRSTSRCVLFFPLEIFNLLEYATPGTLLFF
jgi:hypothetical protein